MTLGGMSVGAWLEANAPVAEAARASSDEPMEGAAAGTPLIARMRSLLTVLAASALGAWLAAPAFSSRVSCPPAHEGAVYCHLEHNVLRGMTAFLLVTGGSILVARLAARMPELVRWVRARGWRARPASPAARADALLVAACRGRI